MMNRLICPLAQISSRARTKASQPAKAITPGTSGRSSLVHRDGTAGRTDLSSSEVDVSCKREPPPACIGVKGKFLARRAQPTRARPYAVTGCNEYSARPDDGP